MNQHEVNVVFVPRELDPAENPGHGQLELDDAAKLLKSLAERQSKIDDAPEREAVSILAAQLLHQVKNRDEVLAAVADLPLFTAKDCRDRQDTLVTWSDLQQHRDNKTLFVTPSPRAYSLQKAISDESVILISRECFEAILPGESPSQCTQGRIIDVFIRTKTPMLAGPGNRVDLLKALIGFRPEAGQFDTYQKSVRFLFHGEASEFDSTVPLLITGSGESDIWRRVTHSSLAGQNSQWRLLNTAFGPLLSGEHQVAFSIQPVGAESAIPLIAEIGPGAFSDLHPSPSEYTALLKEIDDEELCKQLPIHQDVDDRFVAIDASSFWESDVALPNELNRKVTILRRSSDEATWRRQRDLARPLDATAVIEIVLAHDEISPHWATIMDSLQQASALTSDSLQQLQSRPWLPSLNGDPIAPVDVIDLPKIAKAVARLVTELPGIFYEPGMLPTTIREHSSYESLKRQFLPNAESALSMLGELLVEDINNRIGPVRASVFDDWKAIASIMPVDLLSCGDLLQHAAEHYPSSTRRVFEQLTQHEITPERIACFLNHLRQSHQTERNVRRRDSLVTVFNEYLRLHIKSLGYANSLADQELLNAEGKWMPAVDLCCANDGIASSNVVDNTIEEIIAPSMPVNLSTGGISSSFNGIEDGRDPDWATIQPELEAAGTRLRQYFEPWRDIVPNEQIGGFLSLLGDDPEIVDLASQYLGKNRTLEETRIKFGLPEMKAGHVMEDGLTMMSKQRIVVETITDANVRVLNLLGEPILVPRNTAPKNIFIGYGKRHYPFPHSMINGKRVLCFRLNEINPREQTEADLSRLLKDSAVQFIGNAYNAVEKQTSFASAWDELSESDQLDISIAQERIIEHGFLILDQLGLRSDPHVAAILDKWDAADRLLAEQRSGAESRPGVKRRHPDVELREAKNDLRDVLENNLDVQYRILEAIKLRVAEYYQYTKAAVPFEIFQNADDAAIEFVDNWEVTEDERIDSTTLHVAQDDDCLTMAHFGRRINQYPLEKRDATMGFDNDLWKMLVLSLSNKLQSEGDETRCVTGKFGLGFKSSYLVCDRPKILSGRLAFEVTGAMYPRRLIADERAGLDQCRETLVDGKAQSTIFQLPLNSASVDEVLADFLSLAHLAVVFARQIKHCILNGGDHEARWEPTAIADVRDCYTGTLSALRSEESGQGATQALLLESDHGSILFAVDSRSLDYFDDDIPTIWVTAPTREFMELGFLINGRFALDVGRAQLAREFAQNSETAAQLGAAIGEQLCELFQVTATEDGWNRLAGELRLAGDATVYDFWDSLFSLIGSGIAKRTQRDTPADALIREVFWADSDRGAARLYRTCQAIPTRMRGDYKRLVSVSQIKYAISGLLTEDPDIFSEMSTWETFQQHAPAGKVVSHSQVFESLRQIDSASTFSVSHVNSLNLATVLSWEFHYGHYAKPEDAARFGTIITKKTLELISDPAEYHAVRDVLDQVQFKGRDNRFHPAKDLLIGHETDIERDDRREDERFRAQFAPVDRVLSDEYQGAAMAFFDVCRDTLEAPARMMAEWVVGAADLPHQVAALKYLARGQLATPLLLELKRRGFEGSWLADLGSSAAFRTLDESTRNRLLDLLPKDGRPKTDWDSFFGNESVEDTVDAAKVLNAIHDWWGENRKRPQDKFDGRSYLQEYARRTYPKGDPTQLASDDDEQLHRAEWTTLLLLGLMHTIGRAKPGHHRQFIAKCDAQGWLQMFAASEQDSDRWMKFVADYLDRQIDEAEYFHWMRQFVGIFQMSRYLDDYIELFLAIEFIDRPFRLTEVIHSRSSSLFQGGGVSAPPLSRVLGLGSCFVVRELVRLEVLTNEYAMEHCFVPVKRVRDVFERLGCDALDLQVQRWDMSNYMYHFIVDRIGTERAAFWSDFDIPFQFISEDDDLTRRFFNTTALADQDGDDETEWGELVF
ncbi:hypothetical protein OAF34_05450 [Pirellulaceae bacterium]|nr:hypothetical protein [Pirellulaceae bacterium]